MKIQILISNSSWADLEYKKKLTSKLKKYSKKIFFTDNHLWLKKNYDLNIIFSYFKIIPLNYLKLSKHNVVVHGSHLPKGRGMSPITWQILEKKNRIVFSLIEANQFLDKGRVYYKNKVFFPEYYLFNEIKNKQFFSSLKLIEKFIKYYKKNKKAPPSYSQKGIASYYRRRLLADSKLDINSNIKSQFNLLRIVDNEKYPAFFKIKNKKYIIKILKK